MALSNSCRNCCAKIGIACEGHTPKQTDLKKLEVGAALSKKLFGESWEETIVLVFLTNAQFNDSVNSAKRDKDILVEGTRDNNKNAFEYLHPLRQLLGTNFNHTEIVKTATTPIFPSLATWHFANYARIEDADGTERREVQIVVVCELRSRSHT